MAIIRFKGTAIKVAGEMPKVGSKAPNFSLAATDLSDRTLQDFAGKQILLYTVPSLDTSVCLLSTKKWNELAKSHPDLAILVVSADLPFAQNRICGLEKVDIVTPLSTMRSHDFAQTWGVLIAEGPLRGLLARSLILIDQKGVVQYTQLVPEVTQEPDYEAILNKLT